MFRVILGGLRRRRRRAVALVVGILVATTGFTVLTSSTQAAKLTATAAVDRNARGAYDILVRPSGSQSVLEKQRELVAPNFLAGDFGGISLDQWHRIEGIDGVDIAAPVANLGYVPVPTAVTVDLTARVRPDLATQVLEIAPTWTTDRGLTVAPDTAVHYVYVTSRPVVWAVDDEGLAWHWSDHKTRPGVTRCDGHWKQLNYAQPLHPAALEIEPDGTERMLCANDQQPTFSTTSTNDPRITVVQRRPDGRFDTRGDIEDRLTYNIDYLVFLMMSAIDPIAESRLVGLNGAVVSGRPFDPHDTATVTHGPDADDTDLPVLASTTPYIDASLSVAVSRLDVPVGADVATPSWVEGAEPAIPPVLINAPATVVGTVTTDADAQYRAALAKHDRFARVGDALTFDQPKIDVDALGRLAPQPVMITARQAVDSLQNSYGVAAPTFTADTPARTVTSLVPHDGTATAARFPNDRTLMNAISAQGVLIGEYDPAKLAGFSGLSAVPMETYQAPELPGADAPSRKALDDKPLIPSGNPGAYLSSPPLLLTTLDALPVLKIKNPISAVRVRLTGNLGVDPVSRERVRVVAERIAAATGLDVDITYGSSPQPQGPSTSHGGGGPVRPARAAAVGAVDPQGGGRGDRQRRGPQERRAVRPGTRRLRPVPHQRRRRRGPRPAHGARDAHRARLAGPARVRCRCSARWPGDRAGGRGAGGRWCSRGRLGGYLLDVLRAVGAGAARGTDRAAAGSSGRAAARRCPRPGPARRRGCDPRRCDLGGAGRPRGAGRARPAQPAAGARADILGAGVPRSAMPIGGHGAGRDHLRLPRRDRGHAARRRGVPPGAIRVDTVAVAATVLLGALGAVADVLYLNIRDRSAELATLRATGWTAGALARLVAAEGFGIGVLGGLLGAGLGLAGLARRVRRSAPDRAGDLDRGRRPRRRRAGRDAPGRDRPGAAGCNACPPPACWPRSEPMLSIGGC